MVTKLGDALSECHRLAREHLTDNIMRGKRNYDTRLKRDRFLLGDIVYQVRGAVKPGQSKKLLNPVIGPFLVVSVYSPILYKIMGKKKSSVIHHDRLVRGHDRCIPIWLQRLRQKLLAGELSEDRRDPIEDIHGLWKTSGKTPKTVTDKVLVRGDPVLVDTDPTGSYPDPTPDNTDIDNNSEMDNNDYLANLELLAKYDAPAPVIVSSPHPKESLVKRGGEKVIGKSKDVIDLPRSSRGRIIKKKYDPDFVYDY